MKRYTQGFYKFGPMEMNDQGEWVRYEDVESLRSLLQITMDRLEDNQKRYFKAQDKWFITEGALRYKLAVAGFIAFISIAVAAVFIISFANIQC